MYCHDMHINMDARILCALHTENCTHRMLFTAHIEHCLPRMLCTAHIECCSHMMLCTAPEFIMCSAAGIECATLLTSRMCSTAHM